MLRNCMLTALWNIIIIFGGDCIKLLSIDGPSIFIIENENPEPIVLDCNYDLETYNSSLVIKWLKDEIPIYQWIKGLNPTAYPHSKNIVDETFQISEDPFHKYRGLAIPNPSINTTGNYKCIIETIRSTQWLQKMLQVIDVVNYDLNLEIHTVLNETYIECEVSNVYPIPSLRIWSQNMGINILKNSVSKDGSGYYNATSTAAIINDSFENGGDDDVKCTLYFPGYNFNKTIFIESSSTEKSVALTLIIFMTLIVFKS